MPPRSDIQKCNLDCLDFDAFRFPGARTVKDVFVQQNDFPSLPETLLRNMTSMTHFYARNLVKMPALHASFFQGLPNLEIIWFTGCSALWDVPDSQ